MKIIILFTMLMLSVSAQTVTEIKSAFENKAYKSAYAMAQKAYANNSDDVEINFYLGRSAVVLGQFDEALAAFDRALIADESNDLVRLERARLYLKLGMLDLSEGEFKRVLSHKPPAIVQKNIAKFLALIESKKRRSFLHLGVALGYGYDQNKNSNPGQGVLEEFMKNEYSLYNFEAEGIKSDTFVEGSSYINYIYDMGEKNAFAVALGAVVYKQDFSEDDAFDLLYYQTNIAPFYTFGSYKATLKLEATGLDYANDALFKTYGSEFELSKLFQTSSLSFSLNGMQRQYDKLSERDSNIFGVGLNYGKYFNYDTFSTSFYISKEKSVNDTNSSFIDNTLAQVRLAYNTKRLKFFDLFTAVMMKQTSYKDALSSHETSKREDRYISANIGVSKKVFENFNIVVKHTYSKSSSNYKPAQYSKQVSLLSCSYNY